MKPWKRITEANENQIVKSLKDLLSKLDSKFENLNTRIQQLSSIPQNKETKDLLKSLTQELDKIKQDRKSIENNFNLLQKLL